jgi:L-serine dehydratase
MSETSWSVFDVIGPVMIGPSSSHTAGAAKIGYFARIINGQQPKEVKLLLHGSFGKVYTGHCTDKAIIGGLMGYLPHDGKIEQSYEIAKEAGMSIDLKPSNLGDTVHPNSVRIEMKNADGSFHRVRAKSIGGGKIVIREIDKVDCSLDMSYSCIVCLFDTREIDALDLLMKVKEINGHIVQFDTSNYKDLALLHVEMREHLSGKVISALEKVPGVEFARYLNHLSNYNHYADEDTIK